MLNIHSLNNVRDQKEINKQEIYKKVLQKCHHRIKICANKGSSECCYIVPEYIYGIPKYDILNCALYIVNKLNLNGFTVKYTYPNLIYINWKHIPSEIKKSKQIVTNNKKQNSTKDRDFRFIEDYKPSLNFLDKII
jgi:hypothetical protein